MYLTCAVCGVEICTFTDGMSLLPGGKVAHIGCKNNPKAFDKLVARVAFLERLMSEKVLSAKTIAQFKRKVRL